ncbi:ABC transporter permease [Fictibacillus sp. Mic-4]|uniref:ABC transporter permease n=1 Tax=Fictibacillus sp. Mic-4 TaxID=3132826 RepID=UPI003CF9A226
MKNILTVAHYELLRIIRDRKSFILLLAFPLLLTLILGTALGKVGAGQDRTTEKLHIKAAIIDKDHGPMAKQLVSFFESKELKKIVKIRAFSSEDKARKALREEEIGAVVIITKGFSQDVQTNQKHSLEIIDNHAFDGTVVHEIVNSYVSGVNSYQAARTISAKFAPSYPESMIDNHTLSIQGKKPTSMDYYAITMMIMILMYSTVFGRETVRQEIYSTIGMRMKSLPIKPFDHFIGKAVAGVVTVFLQIAVLLIVFRYVYHVNLGSHLPFILGVSFLFAFTMILIAMALSLILNPDAADHILDLAIPVVTFIAGGFFRIPFFETNPIMMKIQMLLPNVLTQKMIFQKIYGGQTDIQTNFIFLIGILILAFILVLVGLRRYQHGHLSK